MRKWEAQSGVVIKVSLVQPLGLLLISCVMLGRWFNLSEAHFPHLWEEKEEELKENVGLMGTKYA